MRFIVFLGTFLLCCGVKAVIYRRLCTESWAGLALRTRTAFANTCPCRTGPRRRSTSSNPWWIIRPEVSAMKRRVKPDR